MRLVKANDLPKSSNFWLIYSYGGVGKSTSAIQSLPGRVAYISLEPRNPQKWLEASGRDPKDIDFFFPESYDDLIQFILNAKDNLIGKYKSLCFDGVSYFMETDLSFEIMDEHFESKKGKNGKVDTVKVHSLQSKMSEESYGILAKQMERLFRALAKLTFHDINVIVLTLLDNNPTYKRALKAGPALSGRAFAKIIDAFCDLIGKADTVIEDEVVTYPPLVSFEGDGSFWCKYVGTKMRGNAFDLDLDFKYLINNL